MFERFSSEYYVGRLYVEPRDVETAAMCRAQHERVNRQLYASGEGVERLDLPLVMKLGPQHIAVHGAEDVPQDTLAVPESTLENADVRNPPTLKEVLLAEADRARELLSLSDGDPSVGPPAGI
ncbi:MAG: DUF5802 family protein [Haloarculaceae archaeon]